MGHMAVKDELIGKVAALAETRGISVEQQAEELLRAALDRAMPTVELRKRMYAVAELTPAGVLQTDSVEFLREDRNR